MSLIWRYGMKLTSLVSLLIPNRIGASLLRTALLLLAALVEHVIEELKLGGRWEDEEEQRPQESEELHCYCNSYLYLLQICHASPMKAGNDVRWHVSSAHLSTTVRSSEHCRCPQIRLLDF